VSTELEQLNGVIAELGLPERPGLAELLLNYLDLLQRWNATYNLTSVRERQAMYYSEGRVLDVGSGGGLPGVVLAAALPKLSVTCVDTVGKKAAFVRQVAGSLGLGNLHAAHARVEALKLPSFDLITSRAFATLATFVALTESQLGAAGVWLAMKGQNPEAEIAELPAHIEVFHVEQLVVPGLDAQRCLVWMRRRPA